MLGPAGGALARRLERERAAFDSSLDILFGVQYVFLDELERAGPVRQLVVELVGEASLLEHPLLFRQAGVHMALLRTQFWCQETVSIQSQQRNSHGLFTVGYAAALAIHATGCFENILCIIIKSAFKIIETWCTSNGLSVRTYMYTYYTAVI